MRLRLSGGDEEKGKKEQREGGREGGKCPAEIDGFPSMDFLTGSRKEMKLVWVTVGMSATSFVKQGKSYLTPSQKH